MSHFPSHIQFGFYCLVAAVLLGSAAGLIAGFRRGRINMGWLLTLSVVPMALGAFEAAMRTDAWIVGTSAYVVTVLFGAIPPAALFCVNLVAMVLLARGLCSLWAGASRMMNSRSTA